MVVAIVVIGPKELPRTLRAVGHWTGKARRMAGDFQRQFNEALREAELDDVKKSVAEIGKIDPLGDIRKEMSKTEAGIKTNLEKATKVDTPKPEPAKAEAEAAQGATNGAAAPAETAVASAATVEEPDAAPAVPESKAASAAPELDLDKPDTVVVPDAAPQPAAGDAKP
ncbi:MAG: twin-arginine translocase subunit TatB [Bauldia sp.]|nr:twin-arginine translocase subunit TatB [Bauldia sp.]